MAAKRRRCKGTTKVGKPCRVAPLKGGDHCLAHSDEKTRDSARFGGPQPGSGRPRAPHAVEALRQRIEDSIEAWIAPYEEAVKNAVLHATHEGKVHVSDVPDLGARIKAAEAAFDRAYGRPRQVQEIVGAEGGPIRVSEEAFADPKTRKALHELVRRVGAARTERTRRSRRTPS
jgi:hypothetical protein